MSPIQTGGQLKPKIQTLDEAWAELTRLHPELAALPDPDRRPPNEESLDELLEQGQQFTPVDWHELQARGELLTAAVKYLEEPDATILTLWVNGCTLYEIGKVVNRDYTTVSRRLKNMSKRFLRLQAKQKQQPCKI